MRANRAIERDVAIPPCQDRERRELLEWDDAEWLRFYFAEGAASNPFSYAFTSQQVEMIAAIRHAIRHGGDQAIAASRGEGKTTIVERLLLKYTLQGVVNFSVLFSATGAAAENSLDSIKGDIVDNALLAGDYPEACVPVLALENTPNRAHYMTVSGHRHDNGEPYEKVSARFKWCGNQIFFPLVPGSPSSAAIIATRGLDAAVRGLKIRGKRPRVAVIDDPDTEETARSEEQAAKLEDRIDKGIAGLGGQSRPIARVMLTTLQSRTSASYKFTDPKQKPSWSGRRFRFLVTPPTRLDLWEEYIGQRIADQLAGDKSGRAAHAFYLANRAAMDAGAAIANENRHDATILDDGTRAEVSALERYFNEVARVGQEAVSTELDNDPPEQSGIVESGITPHRIQRQLSGFARKTVPADCPIITCGVDVGKVAMHWVVRAWMPNATGFVVDYGVHEVHGTIHGSDEGLDQALHRALLAFVEERKADEYVDTDGQTREINLTLVDAGYRTDAIYSACAAAGVGIAPIMGFGASAGCVKNLFADVYRNTPGKKPGDGWFRSRKGAIWLVGADADRWKAWEHDRWMTAPDQPGSMRLFGVGGDLGGRMNADEMAHTSYARHICNEVEIEEQKGGTIRRRWKAKSNNTHWLDASYYADVAASMLGVRLSMAKTQKPTRHIPEAIGDGLQPAKQGKRLSLAEMQRRGGG